MVGALGAPDEGKGEGERSRKREKAKLAEVSRVVSIVPVGVTWTEARGGREARVGDTSGPTGFASNPRFIDREVPGEPNGRPCVRPALLKQNLYRHFMRLIYAARVKPTKMDGTNDSEVNARGGRRENGGDKEWETGKISRCTAGNSRRGPGLEGDCSSPGGREKMENAVARGNGVAKISAEEEGRAWKKRGRGGGDALRSRILTIQLGKCNSPP